MTKVTTKEGYKKGYEAALANKPRKSPHRDGTASEALWLEGYDAYVNGGAAPQEPRKRRTKTEMEEVRSKPFDPADFNKSSGPISPALIMESTRARTRRSTEPRKPSLIDNIFAAKKKLETETDSELRELIHMELADLEWAALIEDGPKPSTIWGEYKSERGLNFDKTAA